MITENGETLSSTQFKKRLKAVLKQDQVMDRSGHLSLDFELQWPLPEPEVAEVQSRTIEALNNQGIAGFDEEKTRAEISIILYTIARPQRGKPQPKLKPKPKQQQKQQQQKPNRAAYQRPQPPIIIHVTVKKARNFHYPRDLPSGGES